MGPMTQAVVPLKRIRQTIYPLRNGDFVVCWPAEIDDDADTLMHRMVAECEKGNAVIYVWRTTNELRDEGPPLPLRGNAAGFFVGPYQIAALTARESLASRGIDIDILFAD